MYRVERKDGRIIVYDLNDKPVYNASEASWVVTSENGKVQAVQLKERTDSQLLILLATAVKLPMDKD
jgi:hypothetical protein